MHFPFRSSRYTVKNGRTAQWRSIKIKYYVTVDETMIHQAWTPSKGPAGRRDCIILHYPSRMLNAPRARIKCAFQRFQAKSCSSVSGCSARDKARPSTAATAPRERWMLSLVGHSAHVGLCHLQLPKISQQGLVTLCMHRQHRGVVKGKDLGMLETPVFQSILGFKEEGNLPALLFQLSIPSTPFFLFSLLHFSFPSQLHHAPFQPGTDPKLPTLPSSPSPSSPISNAQFLLS